MKYLFFFLGCILVCLSCKRIQYAGEEEIIVKVKDKILYRPDVTAVIPGHISSADSFILAESYIKKWITDQLIYDVANRNLAEEKPEVERLVEKYRQSLIRHKYQERLLKERLSGSITEHEKRKYYEENQQKFVLDKNLIKGLFLKIPNDAPGLTEVKSWYRTTSESSLEKIEKYSLQNATIYDYFYDRWVDFDEVTDNIPRRIPSSGEFLRNNKYIEVADSTYTYLLNINDFVVSGNIAPYEYAQMQIEEMLINQRKVEYLKKFEDDLYNEAVKKGTVEFYTQP
ncbi:MAG: peptidyl-prolyl cis-trans isomerase [Tannerellaceae bacterium]|nr:peptidyl-prolyl cis-trans isomerase [Tannerellaceae bacterium]